MRIPLDLYQILGVPIQATPEQIQQAFTDRQQQLPRQQYSSAAIKARNQLLEQAHAVLADEDLRAAYDRNILSDASDEGEAEESGMELEEQQLVGAMLLLQDLGEYSRILDLGATYLERDIDLSQLPAQNTVSEEDVILTMALAYLESGRELWQQQQFEPAAEALLQGRELLVQEQCFPDLQQEVQTDLDKLRPYQVLEKLSLPVDAPERQQGLQLLQEMLDQRGGIDGRRDDQSGLGIDDFLRFVQQLRSHLTVAEQEQLFEREAQRPSAVASYLASYAFVAGGFSQGKPAKIQQAQARLQQLASRQDTYVEQAMCALLLGHPNVATATLPQSQDEESLTFIHQYSEGAEDDIPGLFLYTEHWLQQEVYPYFRDLSDQSVSLQHYFNDKHNQAALCALEPIAEETKGAVKLPKGATKPQSHSITEDLQVLQSVKVQELQPVAAAIGTPRPESPKPPSPPSAGITTAPQKKRTAGQTATAQPAVRQATGTARPVRRPTPLGTKRPSWLPWAGAALLGLVGIGGLMALFSRPKPAPIVTDPSVPETVTSPEVVDPEAPPTPVASPSPEPADGPMSPEAARQIVESWQTIKAEAKGKEHKIEQFTQILVDPMLTAWTQKAQQEKARSAHWDYQLNNLEIEKVEPQGEDEASIYVQLTENAKIMAQGEVEYAYQDPYRARYDVIRQGNQWRIKNVKVLP